MLAVRSEKHPGALASFHSTCACFRIYRAMRSRACVRRGEEAGGGLSFLLAIWLRGGCAKVTRKQNTRQIFLTHMQHGVDLWFKETWSWGNFPQEPAGHGCLGWVRFVFLFLDTVDVLACVPLTRFVYLSDGPVGRIKSSRSCFLAPAFHTSYFWYALVAPSRLGIWSWKCKVLTRTVTNDAVITL